MSVIMRPPDKNWILKAQPDPSEASQLSGAINVSVPLANILLQRGVNTFEDARIFFRPELSNLHDPFLMKDMDKAAHRLLEALDKAEKVLVYGDYDVDGSTSVALFAGFLNHYSENIDYYVPDRYKEGYGISERGLEYAKKTGVTLIVTLDCGIKAVDKVALGNSMGIDFIICDHHNPGEQVPPALAVLDPKQHDCSYPFKELTGCGVGFKLLQAIAPSLGATEEELFEWLDLLAVSIACDIVPINGENRVLARYGLEKLNTNPRPGLKALIDRTNLKLGQITISKIVFGIGPRINAAGRIAHANQSVQLLMAKTMEETHELAQSIDNKNQIRRDYDSEITEEALEIIESIKHKGYKSTVLYKESWHKGVIGIVASRCIEQFYRPTIIMTESNGKASGSARSVDGFDIHEAIASCSHLIDHYGGHKYAAGLTIDIDKVEPFKEAFEAFVSRNITEDQLIPKIEVDQILTLDQVTFNFYKIIAQMAPFGPQNMQPVFVSENVVSTGEIRILKDAHLKFSVKQPSSNTVLDVIGFGMVDHYPVIASTKPFKICYNIDLNVFRGRSSLQLMLKDIKPM